MTFFIDNQTLSDLELFPIRGRANSIFDCYNCMETKGGSEVLHKYFRFPLADIQFLEQRKQQIIFFFHLNTKLKLRKRQFDFVEHYLKNRRMPLRDNFLDATKDGILNKINPDGDYYIITNGVYSSIFILSDLQEFLAQIADNAAPESLKGILNQIEAFLKQKTIGKILENPPEKMQSLSSLTISKLDNFFRVKKKTEFRNLLDKIYELDVLQSMSGLMQQKNYSLPEYVKGWNLLLKQKIVSIHFLMTRFTTAFQ
jgi:DNA mismatch repair protein MutS